MPRLGLAILALAGAGLLASSALAGPPSPANRARLDSTVRYLQNVQQASGGFAVRAGEPGQISTAWVALALAAAGINPQDQAQPGGVDAYTYLVDHFQQGVEESDCAPLVCTTTFERELMVVNAAGASPHEFGGVDLVEGLLARERPDGSFPHVPGGEAGVNDTIFAILALAPIDEPGAQAPIQRAADWVEAAQEANGGWSWGIGGPDEVDMTGAAIQALIAAGRHGTAVEQKGLEYLRRAQNPDGGFPEQPGDPESNVASTAWAVQAIWAAGETPETWLTGSGGETEEPLDYMESLQEPDGHIRWKKSIDTNGVWMTAYVAPAFAGQAWPIPAAPRSSAQPTTPLQSGTGGGTQSGGGVIAGGGGNGAPLFSRPKPQSKGRTPGGARVIHNKGARPTNHSRSSRGDNTEQPSGTESVEPASSEQPSVEVEAVGIGGGSAGSGSGSRSGGSSRASKAGGGQASGREVSGVVVGGSQSGGFAFGAPGLHGAGGGHSPPIAIAIGGAALLLALGGAGIERRQELAA